MSYIKTVMFEDGLHLIEQETRENLKPSIDDPKELPLEEIKLAHSVFQPRKMFEGQETGCNEEHLRVLVEAIHNEPSHKLDPITVWWSGKYWRVIDGNHSYLAYQRVQNLGKLKIKTVPVKTFKGNLREAIAESTRLNSKDKLALTREEKMNRAWIMVCLCDYSKNEIARTCKVATTTVARMRLKLGEIRDHFKDRNEWKSIAMGLPWDDAKKLLQAERTPVDDSWQEKLALDWSRRLAKTFGKKFAELPNVSARALEMYSEKMVESFCEQWADGIKDAVENRDF